MHEEYQKQSGFHKGQAPGLLPGFSGISFDRDECGPSVERTHCMPFFQIFWSSATCLLPEEPWCLSCLESSPDQVGHLFSLLFSCYVVSDFCNPRD